PLIGLMLLITGLVVANTLKLNQMQRREEVDILALVGASGRYIQFPLLVSGAVQGFLGGIISLGLLKGLHLTIEDVLYFPPLWIRIEFLPLPYALAIPGVLTLVGILSSFLAVRGRLR
ncbi:FtsX-like permease family protein, partial [Desulfonatronospira sp.]|uniref:cell division protein FtsX n=1 Tax=Desulfonatronospira sp. TaxID=1962951 RepID=UPI00344362C2